MSCYDALWKVCKCFGKCGIINGVAGKHQELFTITLLLKDDIHLRMYIDSMK